MKVIVAIGFAMALTGCGTVQEVVKYNFTPSVDLAQEECIKIGFKVGTPNYQMCVMRQTESIRNARAHRAAASEAARISATPMTITCSGTGSIRTCTSN